MVLTGGGGGEGSKSESHLGTFSNYKYPGDSDKLPNPREESPWSVSQLLLYLYTILGGKSRLLL